jgi:triosephosphate isomerase
MSRLKLFGTWKNRLTCAQSVILAKQIVAFVQSANLTFELSICPPMTALKSVKDEIPPWLSLTAQNLIWNDKVSFTGETTGTDLHEIGCRYVIIGHSERRLYLSETNETVAKKVLSAREHQLIPVVCVGEFYDDYKEGRTTEVIETQLQAVMTSIDASGEPPELIIAYEPAWAISTSREALKCDPSLANQRHIEIREIVKRRWGPGCSNRMTILYGGSVTDANAEAYFAQSDIDGGLVGASSQNMESFIRLINVTRRVFEKKHEKTLTPL